MPTGKQNIMIGSEMLGELIETFQSSGIRPPGPKICPDKDPCEKRASHDKGKDKGDDKRRTDDKGYTREKDPHEKYMDTPDKFERKFDLEHVSEVL